MSITNLCSQTFERTLNFLRGKHVSQLFGTGDSVLINKLNNTKLNLDFIYTPPPTEEPSYWLLNRSTFVQKHLSRFGKRLTRLDIENVFEMISFSHEDFPSLIHLRISFVGDSWGWLPWLRAQSTPFINLLSLEFYESSEVSGLKVLGLGSIAEKLPYLFPSLQKLALTGEYKTTKNLPPLLTELNLGKYLWFDNDDTIVFPNNITRLCFNDDDFGDAVRKSITLPSNIHHLSTNYWRPEFIKQDLIHLKELRLETLNDASVIPSSVTSLIVSDCGENIPLHLHSGITELDTGKTSNVYNPISYDENVRLTCLKTCNLSNVIIMKSVLNHVGKLELYELIKREESVWHYLPHLRTLRIHSIERSISMDDFPKDTLSELDIAFYHPTYLNSEELPSSLVKLTIRCDHSVGLHKDFNLGTSRFHSLKELNILRGEKKYSLESKVTDIRRMFSRNLEILCVDMLIPNLDDVQNTEMNDCSSNDFMYDIPSSLVNVNIKVCSTNGIEQKSKFCYEIDVQKWLFFFSHLSNSFKTSLNYINLFCLYEYSTWSLTTTSENTPLSIASSPVYIRTDLFNVLESSNYMMEWDGYHETRCILKIVSKHLD